MMAQIRGISISVISLVDSECLLDMLCPIADLTGGNILKVNPLKLEEDFENCIAENIIAANVKVIARIPFHYEFNHELDGKFSLNNSVFRKKIGNVTKETVLTLEYQLKSQGYLDNLLKSDYNRAKYCPIQFCIYFTNLKGMKCVKVITNIYEVTSKLEEMQKDKNTIVLGCRVLQYAAELCKKGEYLAAKSYTQKEIDNFSGESKMLEKLRSMNEALQEQLNVNQMNGHFSTKKDSLTQKINQATKTIKL